MEAMLIQGWLKTTRLLALINKGSTNALVILLTSRTPPQVYSDLTIERILPIDQDFQCDIGNQCESVNQVNFNIFLMNIFSCLHYFRN